jgi:hypothetical protein
VDREVTVIRAEMAEARAALPAVADRDTRQRLSYEQALHDFRRFDRLFRLMLNEGDRAPELREAIWSALQKPMEGGRHDEDVVGAIAMAALGGYHLFSMMQGHPYNGIGDERFVRTLVDLTQRAEQKSA